MQASIFVSLWFVLIVTAVTSHAGKSNGGSVLEYFIAAVEREWDYAPSGVNQAEGVQLEQDRWVSMHIV